MFLGVALSHTAWADGDCIHGPVAKRMWNMWNLGADSHLYTVPSGNLTVCY